MRDDGLVLAKKKALAPLYWFVLRASTKATRPLVVQRITMNAFAVKGAELGGGWARIGEQ